MTVTIYEFGTLSWSHRFEASVFLRRFRFVRFSAVDFFVGFAGGADAAFQAFDKPECEAPLFASRTLAQRTRAALFGKLSVFLCDLYAFHWRPL